MVSKQYNTLFLLTNCKPSRHCKSWTNIIIVVPSITTAITEFVSWYYAMLFLFISCSFFCAEWQWTKFAFLFLLWKGRCRLLPREGEILHIKDYCYESVNCAVLRNGFTQYLLQITEKYFNYEFWRSFLIWLDLNVISFIIFPGLNVGIKTQIFHLCLLK